MFEIGNTCRPGISNTVGLYRTEVIYVLTKCRFSSRMVEDLTSALMDTSLVKASVALVINCWPFDRAVD